jgi:hypothetical protein
MKIISYFAKNKWSFLLVMSIILEMMLHSSWLGYFGIYFSQWVIIILGSLICISGYHLFQQKCQGNEYEISNLKWIVFSLLFIGLSIFSIHLFNVYVLTVKIDPISSDVIPTLQAYNKRLLTNQYVYDLVPYKGYHVVPNYLPMQWLPYLPAEFLQIDYRLYGLIYYLIAFAVVIVYSIKKNVNLVEVVLRTIAPFFPVIMYAYYDLGTLTMSIEQVIVVYYVFLAMALFTKRWWVLATAISFCLLSRFSFVYWLPFLIIFAFYQFHWKQAIYMGIFVLLFALCIYVIPFMSKDATIFMRGIQYYVDAAPNEWIQKGWQQATDPPFHLAKGLGFNIYFNDFWKGSLTAKIAACRHFQLVICLFIAMVSGYILIKKKSNLSAPLFALLSLKIYMVFFYQFIQVPYIYLQWVTIGISMIILIKAPLFRLAKN